MATIINEAAVASMPAADGVERQSLLSNERIPGCNIAVDRLTLKAGATARYVPPADTVTWWQMVLGKAVVDSSYYREPLTSTCSVLMPPGFGVTLTSDAGASLIQFEIPYVRPANLGVSDPAPNFSVMSWAREAVFQSMRDARKRVPLVDPKLFGPVLRGEMLIFPAGSAGPLYHHDGAATLIYVMYGNGTLTTSAPPAAMKPGDLIYLADGEQHFIRNAGEDSLRCIEVCTPGQFKTVWADPHDVTGWRNTHLDVNDMRTAEDQREHDAFARRR